MIILKRHWVSAITVALLGHASLLFLLWEPAKSGAASLGVGGVSVSFGMAGGAPGATEVSPPEVTPVDAPETPQPVAEVPPEPVQETVQELEPVEAADVEPIVATAVEVVKIKPKTEKVIVPKKPKPKEVQDVPPTPQPPVAAPPEIAAKEPVTEVKKAPASIAGSAGKSGTQSSSNVGTGSNTSAGGRPGSSASYFSLLQAWLEKHKEYPSQARQRRQEGTAMLAFTIDRQGRVLSARITRSAGSSLLDTEVMKMIHRADPVPPFPDDFSESEIKLVVPVQFQLR